MKRGLVLLLMVMMVISMGIFPLGCVTPGTAEQLQHNYDAIQSHLDRMMKDYPLMTPEERKEADIQIQRLIRVIESLEKSGDVQYPEMVPPPLLE